MARLRIFVSSTCYDLSILRSELRPFIMGMGYEPVMSEYSDVLYDPRAHTHDSCLKEIPACDMVVLIIGSRFGGLAAPSSLESLDFKALRQLSSKPGIIEAKDKLSVTQLEILKAIEHMIPIYAFVDEKVLHDHHVYEKNKEKKEVIDLIEFPSIQRRDTAKYVFEFINFLSHRVTNNSITGFARLDDIRNHLAVQWSQLFQRLLVENRTASQDERRYRDFSERIEDLKAIVLASLATPDLRDTAKGALQFRRLISFISALRLVDHRKLLLSNIGWDELLEAARIVEIRSIDDERFAGEDRFVRSDTLLVLADGTFYRGRFSSRVIDDFRIDWNSFLSVEGNAREAIVDALLEDREARRMMPMLVYVSKPVEEYLSSRGTSAAQPQTEREPGERNDAQSSGTAPEIVSAAATSGQ